jgi:hypothetical protein
VLFGLLALGLAASCSDSDEVSLEAAIDDFCSSQCAKLAECDILGDVLTQSQCTTACKTTAASESSSDCKPDRSKLDACVSGIKSMSCDDLENDIVPEVCEEICPDDSPDEDSGVSLPDAGISFDLSLELDASGGCTELSACCDALGAGQAKTACITVVGFGSDPGCAGVIPLYCE